MPAFQYGHHHSPLLLPTYTAAGAAVPVSLEVGVAQVLSPLPRFTGPQHHGLQHGRSHDHVGVLAVPLVLGPWAEHVELLEPPPVQADRVPPALQFQELESATSVSWPAGPAFLLFNQMDGSLRNDEVLMVPYPVDDGELPRRVAVDAAQSVRQVLVVVVLLAVGLVVVRRAAAVPASGEDHVEAPVRPPVPRRGLLRGGPVVRRDDAELRQRRLDAAVVGALEPQRVGGVRGAHAQVVRHAARHRHRRRRRRAVRHRELRGQRLRVQRHHAPRLRRVPRRRRRELDLQGKRNVLPVTSSTIRSDSAWRPRAYLDGGHGISADVAERPRTARRPPAAAAGGAADVHVHAAADDGPPAGTLGDVRVEHLRDGAVPHGGLVGRDEAAGEQQVRHAAVAQRHLDGAAAAHGLEAHAVAGKLGGEVLHVDRGGGGSRRCFFRRRRRRQRAHLRSC